ncbi:MAG: RNA polymerase factor sigma-32 [Alphaproteobacteria bacterium]
MSVISDNMLQHYMRQIQQFAPLTFEQEQELANIWVSKKDQKAFHTLMQSYLRLVVKVAMSFRGYGLPVDEMVQEGNIGLMNAIARFEPERGFRLSTYAMWWIRASIQEYILNNWSLVKIGTNSVQKKLFFNLRKLRNQLQDGSQEHLSQDMIQAIATELGVSVDEVTRMEQRLGGGDLSLNNSIGDEEGEVTEWEELLEDENPTQDVVYASKQETYHRQHALHEAMDQLDARERMIFIARRLNEVDETPTLEALSDRLGISRERVRQLEARAYEKVQTYLRTHAA